MVTHLWLEYPFITHYSNKSVSLLKSTKRQIKNIYLIIQMDYIQAMSKTGWHNPFNKPVKLVKRVKYPQP